MKNPFATINGRISSPLARAWQRGFDGLTEEVAETKFQTRAYAMGVKARESISCQTCGATITGEGWCPTCGNTKGDE